MTRTIELALNKFSSLPATLVDADERAALPALSVGVKRLFHHYFLSKYGDNIQDAVDGHADPRDFGEVHR